MYALVFFNSFPVVLIVHCTVFCLNENIPVYANSTDLFISTQLRPFNPIKDLSSLAIESLSLASP